VREAYLLALLLAACGDEAVDVSLRLPSAATQAMYDTSCVTAVRIYVNGANYPSDDGDFLEDCIDVSTPGMTFADLRERIRGKFDMKIPASGLSGIELYAYNGACNAANERDYDLVAYGSAPYVGEDSIAVPVTPNLSCTQGDYTLRPIDILKYAKTASCAMSAWTQGRIGLSTMSPLPFTDTAYWWGGQSSGMATTGLVNVRGLALGIGANSCLAASLYTTQYDEVTCMAPAEQRVCATGGELEAPMIDVAVGYASADATKINRWGAVVYGAVVGPAAIANATVTIDEADRDKGEVVYLDMPPGVELGTGTLTTRAGTSTGPSGLFAVYTQSLVRITISGNGKTVTRTVGTEEDYVSAVLVKL